MADRLLGDGIINVQGISKPLRAWLGADVSREYVPAEDYRATGYTDQQTLEAALVAGAAAQVPVQPGANRNYTLTRRLDIPANSGLVCLKSTTFSASYVDFTSVTNNYNTNGVVIQALSVANPVLVGVKLAYTAPAVTHDNAVNGIGCRDCTNITIEHCEVYGVGGRGFNKAQIIFADSCTGGTIMHNYVHDCLLDTATSVNGARAQLTGICIDETRISALNSSNLYIGYNRVHNMLCTPAVRASFNYQTDGINLQYVTDSFVFGNETNYCGEGCDTWSRRTTFWGNHWKNSYLAGFKLAHAGYDNLGLGDFVINAGNYCVVCAGTNSPVEVGVPSKGNKFTLSCYNPAHPDLNNNPPAVDGFGLRVDDSDIPGPPVVPIVYKIERNHFTLHFFEGPYADRFIASGDGVDNVYQYTHDGTYVNRTTTVTTGAASGTRFIQLGMDAIFRDGITIGGSVSSGRLSTFANTGVLSARYNDNAVTFPHVLQNYGVSGGVGGTGLRYQLGVGAAAGSVDAGREYYYALEDWTSGPNSTAGYLKQVAVNGSLADVLRLDPQVAHMHLFEDQAMPTSSNGIGIELGTAAVGFYVCQGVPNFAAATNSICIRSDATTLATFLYRKTSSGTTWELLAV